MAEQYEGILLGGPREGEHMVARSPVLRIEEGVESTLKMIQEGEISPQDSVMFEHKFDNYRHRSINSTIGAQVTRRSFWVHESISDNEWMVYLADRFAAIAVKLRVFENMESLVFELHDYLMHVEDAGSQESIHIMRSILSDILQEARRHQ